MDDSGLVIKLNELIKAFGPPPKPQGISREKVHLPSMPRPEESSKVESSTPLTAVNANLTELMDYLRVLIKYQNFDLEATRRENDYLRKLLEEGETGGEQDQT